MTTDFDNYNIVCFQITAEKSSMRVRFSIVNAPEQRL